MLRKGNTAGDRLLATNLATADHTNAYALNTYADSLVRPTVQYYMHPTNNINHTANTSVQFVRRSSLSVRSQCNNVLCIG